GLSRSPDGFLMEAHAKLRPVDTMIDGVFLCGTAQGPKDIPDSVAQAKGAAASAIALMSRGALEVEPYQAEIDQSICGMCGICVSICPFNAIVKSGEAYVVDKSLCKGCGACAAACPSGAIKFSHFTDMQLLAQVKAAFAGW
ncbi:MAG: disulfide reductase, partial [Thermoproteota archaeon]